MLTATGCTTVEYVVRATTDAAIKPVKVNEPAAMYEATKVTTIAVRAAVIELARNTGTNLNISVTILATTPAMI